MTVPAPSAFAREADARAKLLALAHQHLVAARGLMEQAAALVGTEELDRPVVRIVAYRRSEGP